MNSHTPGRRSELLLKAQISLEMLMTLGIVLAFTVPVVALLFSLSQAGLEKTATVQAEAGARTLADAVNEVSLEGTYAKRTVFLNLPAGTRNVSVRNSEVSVAIETSSGAYDAVSPLLTPRTYTSSVQGGLQDALEVRGVVALVVEADGNDNVRVRPYG